MRPTEESSQKVLMMWIRSKMFWVGCLFLAKAVTLTQKYISHIWPPGEGDLDRKKIIANNVCMSAFFVFSFLPKIALVSKPAKIIVPDSGENNT